RPELGPPTALRLFADVEDAWATSDAERLASLVDTSAVRIAVKPGAPLTAALTRVAAAFLLQDQLRLVRTQGFQMTRFQYDPEKRAFFTEFLIPLVREYREDAGSADLFFIMGNDDWRANLPVLLRAGIERFHHIHRTVRRLDAETWIAGLGSVSLTPFALKDWERWEEGLNGPIRMDGFRSQEDGSVHPFDFRGREWEEWIGADLETIGRELGPDRTPLVCVSHGPPFGTALDLIHGEVHVG